MLYIVLVQNQSKKGHLEKSLFLNYFSSATQFLSLATTNVTGFLCML